MGLREKMNENPSLTTGVTIAIIVVAIALIIYQFFTGGGAQTGAANKSWYSSDDGATYFSDDINLVPPFKGKKDGKEAVRAYVYQCKGGKPFVAYLERYTPEAKKRVEQMLAKKAPPMAEESGSGVEVKKPGAGNQWVKLLDDKAAAIRNVTCPDGGQPESVRAK